MDEKIIIESKPLKLNIPAFFCFVFAFMLLLNLLSEAKDIEYVFENNLLIVLLILLFVVCGIVALIWFGSCHLVITDKRIHGKAAFGKNVNLPVDMISAVGTGIFKSFTVSTSSGMINFYLLDNLDEINNAVTKLLLNRQQKNETSTQSAPVSSSAADELKKYKELLDSGAITQEEFDTKKNQLLGL